MPPDPSVIDIDRTPGGGHDASWVERWLQTDRLEYLDRDDVDDRVKRQVVGSLEKPDICPNRRLSRRLTRSPLPTSRATDCPRVGPVEGASRSPVMTTSQGRRKVVAELLDELGYDTVDAGPLVEGRRFQKNTPAYCIPMDFRGLQATVYNTFNPLAPRRTPLAAPDAR
jgi:hypothetical protein